MILILLSYIYILYIAVGMGLSFNKWVVLEKYNLLFTVLIGFFTQLIFSTFYAIFQPLDLYFYIVNTAIATVFSVLNYRTAQNIFKNTKTTFNHFSIKSRVIFFSIGFLALLHSSALPFLTDNESYYIQTIKWLNHYGFVKGLSNLHLFLGQTSGWHILQSGFNFYFLDINFNDLNGFLIILSSFFIIENWELYQANKDKNNLFIALFLIAFVFLFLFVDSPSPDLPIFIIVSIIFYLFIDVFKNNTNHINIIAILTLLIILIKATVFPILFLVLILLIKLQKIKHWLFVFILSLISLTGFIVKNSIINGYPLYPTLIGNTLFNFDWQLNTNLQTFYYQAISMYGWQIENWDTFNQLSFIDKFKIWLNLPRLNGILNKLIVLSLVLFPLLIRKRKEMLYIYIYMIIQFVLFYNTSPQYRFFVPILLPIALFISAEIFHKKTVLIHFFIASNIIILLFLGFLGFNFKGITNNDLMKQKQRFITSQILIPRVHTQFKDLKYKSFQIKNLKYFSPVKDSLFFWQTSNGPLPCVNKDMIDYFSTYYNHIPQMRTDNLKDGFKSVNVD